MVIGAFSETVFEVSSYKVSTFKDYKRSTKAKFAEHETIGQPPKLEFLHKELETISMTIIFHKSLGVNPAEEVQKIRDLCENGTADFLIIGEKVVGSGQWIIENVSESVDVWDKDGNIYSSKIDLDFKEYF